MFINRAEFEDYSSDEIMRKQLQSGSGQVLLQSAIASLQVLKAKEFFRDDYIRNSCRSLQHSSGTVCQPMALENREPSITVDGESGVRH